MSLPRFLQLHFLSSYPAVLLNRDDTGLAKRLPFGGTMRTRVSSQCLKRHWRMANDPRALHKIAKDRGIEAVRSKEAIEREVIAPLRGVFEAGIVEVLQEAFIGKIYGSKGIKKDSRQALLLGRAELDYLAARARDIASSTKDAKAAKNAAEDFFKEEKNNIAQLVEQNALAPGLESALFGRMVTSDPRANTDAAIHVAHAFTVHAEESEQDYFTVVDDLTQRSDDNEAGGAGAAGIFDTELTSGLFYGYVVVDVPLLVSNLIGVKAAQWAEPTTDRALAAEVVENLVHLVATISPGAKKGSTAPYSYAEAVLLEAGERQPRTLANAFRNAVGPGAGGMGAAAAKALASELAELDAMYGPGEARCLAARGELAFAGPEALGLPALAQRAGDLVRQATC